MGLLPGEKTDPRGVLLVVDDDPSVRSVARRVLERAGWEVRLAPDGETAVALVSATDEFRGAVVDATMPGLSGADTLRALRALRPSLPLVLMTGYAEDAVQAALEEAGARYLAKPFSPEELRAAVDEAIRLRASGG